MIKLHKSGVRDSETSDEVWVNPDHVQDIA